MTSITNLARRCTTLIAILALVVAMGGTWIIAGAATAAPLAQPTPPSSAGAVTDEDLPPRKLKKPVAGKLNLNTATEDQLMMLPSIGPAKAERIVTWRKKNGGFKRTADLRRVKGFGYKTFKRLEPLLDIRGDTTVAPK